MSVDINAKSGGALNVTNVAWRFVLEFARRCGWNSPGTYPPTSYTDAQPWDGTYDPAMGQFVSDADAASLGEAVKKGLGKPDLSDLLSQTAESLTAQVRRCGDDAPAARVTEKTVVMLQHFAELA
ncbi:MAG: hypothetical protein ABSH08_14250, partial [Tepidisphaeraceae bacterium]